MTYDSLERSEYGSAAVELYSFSSGASTWRYTDSDRDFNASGVVYSGGRFSITRTEPEMSDETTRSSIKISAPSDFPIAMLFSAGAPYESVWVSVFRANSIGGTPILIWQGKVRSVSWTDDGEAKLGCDPIEAVYGKGGFRQTYGPNCHKKLYSARCGAPEAMFTTPIVIESIMAGGFQVSSPILAAKPNQYFRMGELYIPAVNRRVLIVDHSGETLILRTPILNVAAGADASVVAGCDHIYKYANGSWGSCKAVFNNLINFGGCPFTPTKNPYEVGIEG